MKEFFINAGRMFLSMAWLISLVTNTITVIRSDSWVNGIINVAALAVAIPVLVRWYKDFRDGAAV